MDKKLTKNSALTYQQLRNSIEELNTQTDSNYKKNQFNGVNSIASKKSILKRTNSDLLYSTNSPYYEQNNIDDNFSFTLPNENKALNDVSLFYFF